MNIKITTVARYGFASLVAFVVFFIAFMLTEGFEGFPKIPAPKSVGIAASIAILVAGFCFQLPSRWWRCLTLLLIGTLFYCIVETRNDFTELHPFRYLPSLIIGGVAAAMVHLTMFACVEIERFWLHSNGAKPTVTT